MAFATKTKNSHHGELQYPSTCIYTTRKAALNLQRFLSLSFSLEQQCKGTRAVYTFHSARVISQPRL